MSNYTHTAPQQRLSPLGSDEDQETDREQRTSVPVLLDDSNVGAITDYVESRPHTAESVSEIGSKPLTVADKSSVNTARNMDIGGVTSPRSQPIPFHDDPA